jgi:hypothetical protein
MGEGRLSDGRGGERVGVKSTIIEREGKQGG